MLISCCIIAIFFSFQKQNDDNQLFLFDHAAILKETCQDAWPVEICKEMTHLCYDETVSMKCSNTCGICDNGGYMEIMVKSKS